MATYGTQSNKFSISNISYDESINEPIDAVTVNFPSRRIAGSIDDINLVQQNIVATTHMDGDDITDIVSEGGIPPITYTLVSGTGSTDNANFSISGESLSWDSAPAAASHAIRTRATDVNGFTYEEALTFTTTGNPQPPMSAITLASDTIDASAHSNGSTLTTMSTTGGQTPYTYTLVSGTGDTDNGNFTISTNELKWGITPIAGSMSIRVRSTDDIANTYDEVLTLTTTVITSYSANSADLDGSSQYFTGGNDTSLQLVGDMTLSLWAKPTGTGNEDYLLSKYQYTSNQRGFAIRTITGDYEFIVSATGGATTTVTSSGTVTTDWTHIVATYDGSDIKIYIDGSFDNSTSYSSAVHNSTADLVVGALGGSNVGEFSFDGALSGVQVWKGRSLTAGEITTLYNTGKALCHGSLPAGHLTSLSAFWDLANWTGHTSQELTDQTSNGNTLTNVGSTPFTGSGLTVECS